MSRRAVAVGSALTAGFLGEFGYALLLLPLMQHHLVFDRHLSAGSPGIVLGAYGCARLVAQLPFGFLDDRLDGRVAVGTGYLAVLTAGLGLWTPLPLAGVAAVAVVFGLGHALADPLLPAGLAGAVERDSRGRVLSALNLAQVAGLVAGLAGGAFLVDLAPPAVAFLGVAAAHAAILPLLIIGAGPIFRGELATAGHAAAGMLRAIANERVLQMLLTMFLLSLALNVVSPNLSLFAVQRLHTQLHVLTLYLVPGAAAGLAALPLGGWLADRYGRLPPLLGGVALATVAFAALAFVRTPWQAAVVAVFGAAGVTLTMPSSGAALLDVSEPGNRALLLGGMMAAQGLAATLGPLLGGVLVNAGGVALAMGGAAVANWLALPAAVLFESAPRAAGPGRVVPYTPLTRMISSAHIRFHDLREDQRPE